MHEEDLKPQETFLYDDFFMDEDDPGEETIIHFRGKEVPVYIKRALSLEDLESAKASGIKTKLVNGVPQLVSVDENAFTIEVLARAIKSWPFKYSDGRSVPINRKTLRAMYADGALELQKIVANLISARKEALAPLGGNSGGAS